MHQFQWSGLGVKIFLSHALQRETVVRQQILHFGVLQANVELQISKFTRRTSEISEPVAGSGYTRVAPFLRDALGRTLSSELTHERSDELESTQEGDDIIERDASEEESESDAQRHWVLVDAEPDQHQHQEVDKGHHHGVHLQQSEAACFSDTRLFLCCTIL